MGSAGMGSAGMVSANTDDTDAAGDADSGEGGKVRVVCADGCAEGGGAGGIS